MGPSFFALPVANAQLRGTSDVDAALVQQYVNFADNEILPACCTWTFPTLGIMQYNKQVSSVIAPSMRLRVSLLFCVQATEQAQETVKTALHVLNEALATRTFLVGERVTLADITCVCNMLLLYKQVRLALDMLLKCVYSMIMTLFSNFNCIGIGASI